MQTILVASSKGGCGKTTLATNLAAARAQKGRNVVIIDADRQHSSYHWCARRAEHEHLPGVLGMDGSPSQTFDRLPPDTELVIIDTPAGITEYQLTPWLERADAVLVPVLPSVIDLDATTTFVDMLHAMPPVKRGKVPVGLVGNRLKPWTHASQDAVALLRDLPFPVVGALRDSQAYVLLTGLGKSIFDYASEHVRRHQDDWRKPLRWIARNT
ncbi:MULTISPECIES: ParA family protein [Oleiagrimonas]|uniref:ParA family protein n=1 Tax=Oleiagrimonas citrea TaxID=1665687 RepID=A0A846ZQ61_9GAMM|nr:MULTISPECIES: ParA family protein [Oleiagrimonas]NKZ40146.1 ParA family protein [Oleiagrimonas citrea]RAP57065.1 CMP-binding protein [Oleiagrimonas sp. MCCC 1A03011]